jgi:hypothetical protein
VNEGSEVCCVVSRDDSVCIEPVYKLEDVDVIPDRQEHFLFTTLCPETPLGFLSNLVLETGQESASCVQSTTHLRLIVMFLFPVFIIFHDVNAFIFQGT